MKKMLAALLALACLLGLTACDPGWARVDGEELLSNTVKIQLVEYENTAPKYYRMGRKQQACFDFDQTTLLAELDEFGFEDLINDIASYDLMVFNKNVYDAIINVAEVLNRNLETRKPKGLHLDEYKARPIDLEYWRNLYL